MNAHASPPADQEPEPGPGPPADSLRSPCPLAGALDLLGDRWSLLVLRDALFFGKSLFQEFQDSPEGISSNTLADRLKRLEQAGVLRREPYQERPVRHRYVATPKGRDLLPLMREAIVWGGKHVPGAHVPTREQLARMKALSCDASGDADGPVDSPVDSQAAP